MPNILNTTEAAEQIAGDVQKEAAGLKLNRVSVEACRGVRADKECSNTYEKGNSQTEKYRSHVLNVKKFVETVNQIFKEADEKAATGNKGTENLTFLLVPGGESDCE